MAKRITARVSDDLGEMIKKYADEFAITQAQFAGMCIQAGMGTILRAVKPEEAIPIETWAKIVSEVEKLKEQDTGKETLETV